MLYTSYFGKIKTISHEITPVSICGKAPDWYHGCEYKKLAPQYGFFSEWKQTKDNHFYVKSFEALVLNKLNAQEVYKELKGLTFNTEIVLLCYEKPEQFCHRHLVANWFRENGIAIKELGS